jgi:hypothetical protein
MCQQLEVDMKVVEDAFVDYQEIEHLIYCMFCVWKVDCIIVNVEM